MWLWLTEESVALGERYNVSFALSFERLASPPPASNVFSVRGGLSWEKTINGMEQTIIIAEISMSLDGILT